MYENCEVKINWIDSGLRSATSSCTSEYSSTLHLLSDQYIVNTRGDVSYEFFYPSGDMHSPSAWKFTWWIIFASKVVDKKETMISINANEKLKKA